nr:HBS1-like protein isoform X1 [Ipomoea batatas]
MPRKVNYSTGYGYDDDDYYNYDDDDYYNYEDDGHDYAEETEVVSKAKVKRDTSKLGVWRCPICTFDNEDSMSACDICGVLRNPLVKGSRDSSTKVGTSRDSEASKLAKSLFASLLQQNPKKAVTFEGKSDVFKSEGHFNFHEHGRIHGQFQDLLKAFSCQNHYKFNIEPFKFDTPSLDDMVSGGIHSSRVGSKATSNKILQSNASSGKDEMMTGAKAELIAGGSSIPIAKFGPNEIKQSASSQNSSKQGLSKSMKNLSVSSKSQSTEKGSIHDNVEDKLSQLNLAVVGHVDSGKSTLSGRLLHMLGHISRKDMHKNEKEAKQLGKGSFAYAWALDESAEERERGITMNVAVAFFNTKNYHVVLLDSPGHRDFVPNMISGATQADAAILVVDASMGAFEAGIDASGGQTREHALLIKSFGVDQIIVAVNKMDSVQYSKERFDAIKKQLGTFLRTCKFKDSSIVWIPISAMENQNLFTGPSDAQFLSWYQGSSLVDAIDSLQPLVRDYSKPLLMPICDIVKSQSQGHVSVCGKLETGSLQTGFKVLVMPTREIATVRSLERNLQVCRSAKAGDNVTVNLQGIDGNRVMAGGVLCDIDYPVPVTNHLELKVVTLDISTPVLVGSQLEFHVHHAKVAAKVVKLLSLLDPKTGKETKKSPRCLLSKQNAIIEVALQLPVCVDEYANCKSLGRVSFRVLGRTIALGLVTKVLEQM